MCSPQLSPSSTTHDLARRFAAGDPEVLDPIHQRYGPGMHAAARDRLGGDRTLAEEAVQVALLKAWRAAQSFGAARSTSGVTSSATGPSRSIGSPACRATAIATAS